MTLDIAARALRRERSGSIGPHRDERHAMNLIRKSTWAVVLILGAVAGCAGDETAERPRHADGTQPCPGPEKPVVPPSERATAPRRRHRRTCTPRRDQARRDTKKADESPKLEGPEGRATAKGDTAAVKLTRRRDRRDQGTARGRAGRWRSSRRSARSAVDHLGSMGKPIKVSAEGRTFFLCCEGCEKEVKSRPQGGHRQARCKPASEPSSQSRRPGTARPPRRPHPFEQAGVWQRADARDILCLSETNVPPRPECGFRRESGSASLPR